MKRRAMMLVALWVGLMGMTACQSTASGRATWREATVLVIGEGTAQEQTMEGEALREYLRTFVPDERTGFRLIHGSRTGHIMIDGRRYLVTVAVEKQAAERDLLTIHAGSQPLHLMQR